MSEYELLEELGRGAMGTVHRARQKGLDRIVALKRVVAPFGMEASPDYLARFHHEAVGMSKVSHPNLVRVFSCGNLEGVPFIAMELIEGTSLEAMIAASPVEVRRQADALFVQIVKGVAALHGAKLVHRDLKPGNLMIERGGRAVVMDLGLVKDLTGDGTRLTGTGECVGTPRYLSPEVVLGEESTFAADVWALGCIYFEMHAGRTLIEGTGLADVMRNIAAHRLPELDALCPDLPADRMALLRRMLAREPRERPRDAARVLALLEDAKPSRPSRRIESTPSAGTRVSSAADRTLPPGARTTRAVGALLAGALVAGVSGWLATRPAPAPAPIASPSPATSASASAAPTPAERERAARIATERARLAAMVEAAKVGTAEERFKRVAELIDASGEALPAARPALTGDVGGVAGAVVLERCEFLKANAIDISFALVAGERRAEHVRGFRLAADTLITVLRTLDPTQPGGLAFIGVRGGMIVDENLRRLDPRTADRLDLAMRELSKDPDRGFAALLALAHGDHKRGDHAREATRRAQALEHYERRWMPPQTLAKGEISDTWYRILISNTLCWHGPRQDQLARLEKQLKEGDARMAPGANHHRDLVLQELAASRKLLGR